MRQRTSIGLVGEQKGPFSNDSINKEVLNMLLRNTPLTVLMPVYNGAKYLREAIDSILDQSYNDFKFVIINDGSTDQSVSIINSYHDSRIKLYHNRGNRGLVYTLNRGLDLAKSEFIARMDCDDISFPERFAKQITWMKNHPEVGVCGSWIEYFMGQELRLQLPVYDGEIKEALSRDNPIAHPTVMLRMDLVRKYHIHYDPSFPCMQDYELWTRLAKLTSFYNIPEVLLKYRIHSQQAGLRYNEEQRMAMLHRIQSTYKR